MQAVDLLAMGLFYLDTDDARIPKRGDLMQSNVGDRRERTWFILAVRRVRQAGNMPRFKLWIERWWEIEPELRVRLWQSAERHGGQQVISTYRYPTKKRRTFEQHMAGW